MNVEKYSLCCGGGGPIRVINIRGTVYENVTLHLAGCVDTFDKFGGGGQSPRYYAPNESSHHRSSVWYMRPDGNVTAGWCARGNPVHQRISRHTSCAPDLAGFGGGARLHCDVMMTLTMAGVESETYRAYAYRPDTQRTRG